MRTTGVRHETVWGRLGELGTAMRRAGVEETKILALLEFHTPGQIELAFRKHPDLDPNVVADMIRRGRYGFRAGIKKNRAPPDIRPNRARMDAINKQEASCPEVTQEQLQGLLEGFLEGLAV